MEPIVRRFTRCPSGDLLKHIAAILSAAKLHLPDFSMSLIVCGQSHDFSDNLTS